MRSDIRVLSIKRRADDEFCQAGREDLLEEAVCGRAAEERCPGREKPTGVELCWESHEGHLSSGH